MDTSVIISTYQNANYPALKAAIESLQHQTVVPEIIVVVGGDPRLYERVIDLDPGPVILDPLNLGATHARNLGAAEAQGDIVAFLDDDEVAAKNWCAELVWPYKMGAGGVGGKNLPLWECPVPKHLPDEMYWLVGVTHRGFAPDNIVCPIRNTFAGNMSFKKDVFEKIGGFNTGIGLSNGKLIQGEEPEICDRMRNETGLEYWYNSKAIVYNRVPERKTRMWYLLRRAYWQGYTKRMLAENGHSLATEGEFLNSVLSGVSYRLFDPSFQNWGQIVSLVGLSGATGLGYMVKAL